VSKHETIVSQYLCSYTAHYSFVKYRNGYWREQISTWISFLFLFMGLLFLWALLSWRIIWTQYLMLVHVKFSKSPPVLNTNTWNVSQNPRLHIILTTLWFLCFCVFLYKTHMLEQNVMYLSNLPCVGNVLILHMGLFDYCGDWEADLSSWTDVPELLWELSAGWSV